MSAPPYYASARALDPATGDVALDGGLWRDDPPLVAIAVFVLRTPKGRYLPDPSVGVDWQKLDKAAPNAVSTAESLIVEAFKPYTSRGLMSGLRVLAEVRRSALLYDVSFVDPRTNARSRPITGKV